MSKSTIIALSDLNDSPEFVNRTESSSYPYNPWLGMPGSAPSPVKGNCPDNKFLSAGYCVLKQPFVLPADQLQCLPGFFEYNNSVYKTCNYSIPPTFYPPVNSYAVTWGNSCMEGYSLKNGKYATDDDYICTLMDGVFPPTDPWNGVPEFERIPSSGECSADRYFENGYCWSKLPYVQTDSQCSPGFILVNNTVANTCNYQTPTGFYPPINSYTVSPGTQCMPGYFLKETEDTNEENDTCEIIRNMFP